MNTKLFVDKLYGAPVIGGPDPAVGSVLVANLPP